MKKYPDFIDNLKDDDYNKLELRCWESYKNILVDISSVNEDLLVKMDDESLCYLFSKLEWNYDCSEYREERDKAKIPYLICKNELERRNMLNLKIIDVKSMED